MIRRLFGFFEPASVREIPSIGVVQIVAELQRRGEEFPPAYTMRYDAPARQPSNLREFVTRRAK